MGMVITIRRGDEHRAKIERKFLKTDFFADVYTRADWLVGEITQELQDYRDEMEKGQNEFFRYQGMGNNVIIFCGERGQGKTSAMQSFARYLGGISKRTGGEKAPNALELGRSGNNVYEVIESIDPSAMENEESVLRVVISRLFFRLERYINKAARVSENDKEFMQNKREIVKLFQTCYTNIDYIKSGRIMDYEQDDLDSLSQLGSSAKLKANMHDLIEKYLKMMLVSEECGNKRGYLVIPIDDADLATKKVFQLCEDIRNYLSIPNVIILMAADYEQLVQATYQRYLKQYRIMWKAGKFSGHKLHVVDDCHEMAAKYLEKVFPVTHRIDLPQIDYILMEGYKHITFEYIVEEEQSGKTRSAFEGLYSDCCVNLQDQLLELLYKRTGLVFVGKDGKLHPFLPHTLRELMHWVKMLYDMHEIDCDEIYKNYQGSSDVEDDIDRLKENILKVKQYFLNYWCEKNLDVAAVRALQKIDNATRRKQMAEVKSVLYDYLGKAAEPTKSTYSEIMNDIIGKEFEGEGYLREAVCVYYTIFLNEWFALALKDETQFESIVCFVERAIDLSDYKNKKYRDSYHVMQFDVNAEMLRDLLGNVIEPVAHKCLRSFCVAVKNSKLKENIYVSDVLNKKVHLNFEIDHLEFNMFRPFMALLKEDFDEVKELDKSGDSTSDGAVQEDIRYVKMPYLITARNIVANYDVQWQVRTAVDAWYEATAENSEFVSLGEQIPQLYEAVEARMEVPHCKMAKEVVQVYKNTGAEGNKIIEMLFLCNTENLINYLSYLMADLGRLDSEISEGLRQIGNDLQSNNKPLSSLESELTSLLGHVEDKVSQIIIGRDKIQEIAKKFPMEGMKRWQFIQKIYQSVDQKRYEAEQLKKAIEERIAKITLEENGVPAQPDENDEAVGSDTDVVEDGESMQF